MTDVIAEKGALTAALENAGNTVSRLGAAGWMRGKVFDNLSNGTTGYSNRLAGNGRLVDSVHRQIINTISAYSGSLYIPNDANCFQDSAGTTAGAVDAVVGKLVDLVGTNHATQATAGNKPILRKGAVNLLTYSEDFSNAAWVKTSATISANAAASPSGTLTADKLIPNNLSVNSYVAQTQTVAATVYHTWTIYAQQAGHTQLRMVTNLTGVYKEAVFELNTGTISSTSSGLTSSIEEVGGGWYKCSLTGLSNGGATTFQPKITQTGDGVKGVYLWGAQLEIGSTASTYAPTTSAPASNGIGPWHVDFDDTDDRIALASVPLQMTDSGVIMLSCRPTAAGTLFSAGNTADADSRMSVGINASGYATATWTADDGLTTATITGSTDLRGTDCVIEIAKSGNDKSLWVNGVQIGATDSTVIGTTTFTTAKLGCLTSTADSDYASGRLYGFDVLKGTPTDSERAIMRRYLASLGGFSI